MVKQALRNHPLLSFGAEAKRSKLKSLIMAQIERWRQA